MNALTHVQCHFVRGRINHRLRFGTPAKILRLDKYRKLAAFEPGQTVGYIRWRANDYGTQDWRLYIFQTSITGFLTDIPGVLPAVNLCCFVNGPKAMRQVLGALDKVETVSKDLESLPPSYWLTFNSRLSGKNGSPLLPQKFIEMGASHAG